MSLVARRRFGPSIRRSSSGEVDRYSPSAIRHAVVRSARSPGSPNQHPAALGFDGTADPHLELLLGRDRRIEVDDDAAGGDQRTIHDQSKRAVLVAVAAQQHDRLVEIGVEKLRHRQQKGRREGGVHSKDYLAFAFASAIRMLRRSPCRFGAAHRAPRQTRRCNSGVAHRVECVERRRVPDRARLPGGVGRRRARSGSTGTLPGRCRTRRRGTRPLHASLTAARRGARS